MLSKPKKDNNVNFIMRTQIKNRSAKSIKQSQKFQGKSITPIRSALSNNDGLKSPIIIYYLPILFLENRFGAFILM